MSDAKALKNYPYLVRCYGIKISFLSDATALRSHTVDATGVKKSIYFFYKFSGGTAVIHRKVVYHRLPLTIVTLKLISKLVFFCNSLSNFTLNLHTPNKTPNSAQCRPYCKTWQFLYVKYVRKPLTFIFFFIICCGATIKYTFCCFSVTKINSNCS